MSDSYIIIDDGTPISPGDDSCTPPVDEKEVPDIHDDGDRPAVDWGEDGIEDDANAQKTFITQPAPPYRAGDLWDDNGTLRICIAGKTDGQAFAASDWVLAVADDAAPSVTRKGVTFTEIIDDFSQESIASYQSRGAVAYALYDDGTRLQVPWSQVRAPAPTVPETVANEALEIAKATNQHFWHRATDEEQDGAGTGAFVTDEEQNDFLEAIAQDVQPTAARPLHNLLMNAEGILLRAAKKIRAAFTPSGVAFYDGQGNASTNIVASFSADGQIIGKTDESHMFADFHSLRLVDKEGTPYLYISDLRGADGTAEIVEIFVGDGSTTWWNVEMDIASMVSVTVNGTAVSYTNLTRRVTLATAPADGASIVITYKTASEDAKAFTIGTRRSGTIGAFSHAIGSGVLASGYRSHAEGYRTTASGGASHAEGYNTTAGYIAHAEGNGSTANGNYSHAEGRSTASGEHSHSEGASTTASGKFAHAEGFASTAGGVQSHAEGAQTQALASASHAEGFGTYVYDAAQYSHAEGLDCKVTGSASHAEGNGTLVEQSNAHAQNLGTIAASDNQTALGKYNKRDPNGTYAAIIGNGTSDTSRSNALTVDWSGNVVTAGGVTASGGITTTGGASIVKDSRLDRDGTAPSSTQWSRVIGVTDKDGELVGYIQAAQYNDGRIQFQILACNEKSDGTQVNNSFGLIVAKDGTTSYTITNPTALRTALGKYTRSSVGALDWGTNNDYLIAKSALAYWNGAYSGTTSNLAYCNKGAFGTLATKSSLAAADIPSLDAGKITGGTFDVARIPNLAASKITSGTVARARIENTAWAYLVGSASTVASGNYVRWRMVAGIVFLQVYYRSGAGLTAGSAKSIGNIPANYRPSSIVESTGYLGAGNASPCDIWVETNGNAYIVTATAASSKFYGTLSYPLG